MSSRAASEPVMTRCARRAAGGTVASVPHRSGVGHRAGQAPEDEVVQRQHAGERTVQRREVRRAVQHLDAARARPRAAAARARRAPSGADRGPRRRAARRCCRRGRARSRAPMAAVSRLTNVVTRRSSRCSRIAAEQLARVRLAAARRAGDEEEQVEPEMHATRAPPGRRASTGAARRPPRDARRALEIGRVQRGRERRGEGARRDPPRGLHGAAAAQHRRAARAAPRPARAASRAASRRATRRAGARPRRPAAPGASSASSRAGIDADERPPAVALEVEPLVVALGELVVVRDARGRARCPTPQPARRSRSERSRSSPYMK